MVPESRGEEQAPSGRRLICGWTLHGNLLSPWTSGEFPRELPLLHFSGELSTLQQPDFLVLLRLMRKCPAGFYGR